MPEKERKLRINSLIEKELSQIILKEVDFPKGTLPTLTRVETTQKLDEAKVFISTFPSEKSAQIMGILNKVVYMLQKLLDNRLRIRPIPRIRFVEEKITIEADKVEKLIEAAKEKE